MEFRVLGPLEVRRDGRLIDLRGSKRRAVLALLVLQANEIVRTDRLIEDLWGAEQPANAPAALHTHVSRLRKDLGEDVLVTKPWGYVLRAPPESVDLRRFEELVQEARPLPARERSEKLEAALALWRGPALADLANESALVSEIGRLEELRQSVVEQRIDAQLELGEHGEAIRVLEGLIAAHPLRERLRGQLILALYRAGRQAEALETYRETRRVLVDELGIEPSPELRELERAILRQDPSLASASGPPAPPPTEPRPPASRWRWPRSPLLIGAAVLVVIAGAGVAVLATPSSSTPHAEAAKPPASHAVVTEPRPTSRGQSVVVAKKKKQRHKSRLNPKPRGRHDRPSNGSAGSSAAPTTPKQSKQATTSQSAQEEPPAQKPKTKPKTKPKPKSKPRSPYVYWIADDFADSAPEPVRWNFASNNEAVAAVERNGRLELSVDPGRVPEGLSFDTNYGTQCFLDGDFDVRVNFSLLKWPPRNGVNVYLRAWLPQAQALSAFVGRTGQAAAGGYVFEAYTTGFGSYGTGVQTADTDGQLRARRVGGMLSTYYGYHGRWIRLASLPRRGLVRLLIGWNGNSEEFGHQEAVVAFDDFSATADSVDCPGLPEPPKKRRR